VRNSGIRWVTIMNGVLMLAACESYNPGSYDPEESHTVIYGSVFTEDGAAISMMEVSGSFVFGNCSRPDTTRLTSGWRGLPVPVASEAYRHELLYPYSASVRETICADLIFASTESGYHRHEVQVNLTLVPRQQAPDSTQIDVTLNQL
jgi:hypothetical protein